MIHSQNTEAKSEQNKASLTFQVTDKKLLTLNGFPLITSKMTAARWQVHVGT